ncbi:hypothetical protein KP509_10G020000 [Ceratopteris richardii]|uniref:Uncharacterized protein n=1 Tax=Ceratopteris richardii TaxID=49495 RepID=A0A8T2TZM1_CERRI|nr:hypothetical protein KP509_10G020000 [Ceratopteris richardii]
MKIHGSVRSFSGPPCPFSSPRQRIRHSVLFEVRQRPFASISDYVYHARRIDYSSPSASILSVQAAALLIAIVLSIFPSHIVNRALRILLAQMPLHSSRFSMITVVVYVENWLAPQLDGGLDGLDMGLHPTLYGSS